MTDNDTDTGSYMEINLELKEDGNVEAAGKFWPVNNLTRSLFKQMSARLNGTLISSSDRHVPLQNLPRSTLQLRSR